jgi:hypothetical protein
MGLRLQFWLCVFGADRQPCVRETVGDDSWGTSPGAVFEI